MWRQLIAGLASRRRTLVRVFAAFFIFVAGVISGVLGTHATEAKFVYVISGDPADGCHGLMGMGIWWNRTIGDGEYSIRCDERLRVSDTMQLQCSCHPDE